MFFPAPRKNFAVLRAACARNPDDATAHYLLGTLYFSRGLTDSALREWSKARKFGPGLPVLNASMGLALLHEKHDPEHALSAFRDGLRSDPDQCRDLSGHGPGPESLRTGPPANG